MGRKPRGFLFCDVLFFLKEKKRERYKIALVIVFTIALSTVYSFAATDEREPNNSKPYANSIKMGISAYGASDSDSADWFRFNAPVSGTAKITLYMDDNFTGCGDMAQEEVEMLDSNSNGLVYFYDDMRTDGGTSKTFGVTAGKTYYVRAYGDYCGFYRDGIYYHFKVGYYIGKTSITSATGKNNAIYLKWTKKTTYQNYA